MVGASQHKRLPTWAFSSTESTFLYQVENCPCNSSTVPNPIPPAFLLSHTHGWVATQMGGNLRSHNDWSKEWPCNSHQSFGGHLHDLSSRGWERDTTNREACESQNPQKSRGERGRGGCSVLNLVSQVPGVTLGPITSFISVLLQCPKISHSGGTRSARYSQVASNSLTILVLHLLICFHSNQRLGSLKRIRL